MECGFIQNSSAVSPGSYSAGFFFLYPRFFLMKHKGLWWCSAVPGGEGRGPSQGSLLPRGRVARHARPLNCSSPQERFGLKTSFLAANSFECFDKAIIFLHRKHIFPMFSRQNPDFFPLKK